MTNNKDALYETESYCPMFPSHVSQPDRVSNNSHCHLLVRTSDP